MKNLFGILFLLLPLFAHADWLTFHSTPQYAYSIQKIQFQEATSSNNGAVLFWVNEYAADGSPDTRFSYEFPFSVGMPFEQAKMFGAMLMTAYSTGAKIMIGLPGTAISPTLNAANAFNSLRTVQ
jgi:hypothetical protein